MITNFKELSLHPSILATLDKLGITTPTEIQQKAIPVLLDSAKVDFWGQAQTGTGKTFAFGIPLIQNINPDLNQTQAIIIAPTRELVVQITQALQTLGAPISVKIEAIYGGSSMDKQMMALRRGVHIVVGTPGRINDHLKRRTLSLKNLQTLVLDEADIMLDMGFKEEVDTILEASNSDRNIWLFSATIKSGISDIMNDHMKNTVKVSAANKQVSTANTKQYYAIAPSRERLNALSRLIDATPTFYGFIFCQTKALTADVADALSTRGYPANALHGDMNQALRNSIIKKFKNKEFTILVATDVAARGIDVTDLTHVINYSIPHDHESYIHRIGRTGRAGKEGIAISFVNGKGDLRNVQMLERKFKLQINPMAVPNASDIKKVYVERAKEYIKQKSVITGSDHDELAPMIAAYSFDDLKNFANAVLAEKFFANLNQSYTPAPERSSNYADNDGEGVQEIIVHLGEEDGLEPEDITDILTQQGIKTDVLDKLKIIKRRTFIKVAPELIESVSDALQGQMAAGKKIRVSIAIDEGANRSQGGRRSFGSGRGGSDRGGERRGGYDRDRGGSSRDGGSSERGGFRRRR